MPDVIIDSADTLLSNLGSLSETYRILSSILLALRPSGTTRFIVHILAPNPLIPLLAQVRFSPSLFHLKAHPPVLLTHISKAYLTLPPPQTTPEKFYSVFTPLSERHHECEKLVFGTDGEGSGGSEIVVEMVMRCTGGASRKRGVERYLEGWMSNSATSCDLQQLESLKSLWAKQVAMQDVSTSIDSSHQDSNPVNKDAPDPTKNLSFNLNLTEEQQHARSQVPLPYAHEGMLPVLENWKIGPLLIARVLKGKPASTSTPASILYDPDSADDIDDDDPDEDLDL